VSRDSTTNQFCAKRALRHSVVRNRRQLVNAFSDSLALRVPKHGDTLQRNWIKAGIAVDSASQIAPNRLTFMQVAINWCGVEFIPSPWKGHMERDAPLGRPDVD
jgi:hypothetical protein